MKNLFISLLCLFVFSFSAIAQNNVTFQVDMNNVDPTIFTTPEVNGTFNGWCGNCAAMTDTNGDGIWDVTIDIANGAYEFKFAADNWGIQENLLAGSWCTVTNFGFTNRTLTVSGDTTLPVVCWNSCDGCSSGPSSYNVTFEVDMRGVSSAYTTPEVNGSFNGWCGSCWPMTDADGDSVWQFSTIFAPGDSLEWKYSADNWNIQEDLDSALSCITINYDPGAPNGWGFVNRVAVVNNDTTFSSSWNNCVVTGVNGCTDSLAANYDSLATIDDGSCLYSTTFNVNMNCDTTSFTEVNLESPNFSWCGGCVVLLDPDGDGIHSITLDLPIGDFEYKYALDSWAHQEDLVDDMQNGGTCAPVTDYSSFANRLLSVLPGSITNDSYGTCVDCVTGCTDSLACNFDPLATSDDGSCLTVFGCTDSLACNFDPLATCDDGNCLTIYGCMNPIALNYDPLANCPDSCITPSSSSLISACSDFDAGPTAWPYVLVATTVADGASSQAAQTFTMNVIDTASGANFRVVKTTANGNFFFGPAIAMTLGSNSITVPAVTFDRTVKFQFSSGDVEFDFLSLNGDTSDCVAIAGCTDSTALNYNPIATIDDSSCIAIIYGCIDSLAWNYDDLANLDDGSCLYSYMCNNPYPDGLFADNIVDIRATIHWNDMNTDSCRVWKNFIRYKKVTDNTWTTKAAGVGSGLCNVGLPTQQKVLQNLTPNTTYEYKMKSFYCGGMESGYSPAQQFTTAGDCPEMTNLSVQTFGGNHYKARFSWDTTGAYVFARIALRIDTAGANWQTAGGFGIYYPSLSVNKFGLQSGQSYRAQGRTFCDSNITIYRSWWTSPIFWNQPGSIRLNGGNTINNLDIYPNPTNCLLYTSPSPRDRG